MKSRSGFAWPAAALFLVNLVLVAPLLVTERTAHNGSIEGAFIALARFFSQHPDPFGWYPYWYCGTPVQFTYTPGLHYLNGFVMRLAPMLPAGQVYHAVAAVLYALGAVTAAYLAYSFTRARWWALLAGVLWSLWSPAQWLIGEIRRDSVGMEAPWRLQVLVKYGEGPHTASLMLLPLAVCFLWRTVEGRRFRPLFGAALLLAAVVLANWVGAFALGAVCFCFLLTVARMPGAARAVAAGVLAYLLAAFWITPTFIRTVAFNAQTVSGHYEYHSGMIWLAAGALAGLLLIRWLFPAVPSHPYLCFLALSTFFFGYLGLTSYWGGWYMIPQPHRYIPEFELFLTLLVCEALRLSLRRRWGRWVTALVIIAALFQGRHYLVASYGMLKPAPVAEWTEYKLARWLGATVPRHSRVFIVGSEGMSLNEWADVAQVKGWFDPGVRNQLILGLAYQITSSENAPPGRDGAIAVDLLKAVGAKYVVVQSAGSKLAYRDFARPQKFEGLLPLAHKIEDEAAIYEIPGVRLAHVVRPDELPARTPVHGLDLDPLVRYVAAVSDGSRPALDTEWLGPNELRINGSFPADQVVSVRVSQADGWRAYQGGVALPIERDPLGFMVLRPGPDDQGRLRLVYVGSLEQRFCGWISFMTLAICLAFVGRTPGPQPAPRPASRGPV